MLRVFCSLLVMCSVLTLGLAGCGGPKPPENTGQPFEPPSELDQMKAQMMEKYKKGTVNKAQ